MKQPAIDRVYGISEWAGEMAIAASPLLILVGMVMATVSTLLRGSIATSVYFEIPWAIIQAVCVDGLWLGIWIRLHAAKWSTWPLRIKATAMLLVAMLMFLVGTAMSILLTYQEVNGVSDVLTAMGSLHIDSSSFVIARGILVMLCATLAIPFRARKYIPPIAPATAMSEKKSTAKSTPAQKRIPQKATATVDNSPEKSTPPVTGTIVIEEVPAIRLLPKVDDEKAMVGYYWKIREYMSSHEVYTYQEIMTATGASLATVKKWVPKIKRELAS